MRSLYIAILISLYGITLSAQDNLSGIWNTGNQNTVVKIEKYNDYFIGKIISTSNEKAKPGTLIMKDVTLKKGKWIGKMYAPKRDEWYDAEIIPANNKLTITVTVGFFSKTIEWIRRTQSQ